VKAKFFVKSLGLILVSLVYIKYLPLLMLSFVVSPNTDGVTFFILGSFNIKNLVVLPVNELFVLIFENLPPS